MKLSYSSLVAAFFVVGTGSVAAAVEKPSCVDYTKGDFAAQTITSQEICQTACQTAEGFPVGRFNTEEGNPDYGFCYCIKEDQSGKTTDTRDLCQDGTLSSGGSSIAGSTAVSAATTVLVALASMQ